MKLFLPRVLCIVIILLFVSRQSYAQSCAGSALNFAGGGQHVSYGNITNFHNLSSISFGGWIYPTAYNTGNSDQRNIIGQEWGACATFSASFITTFGGTALFQGRLGGGQSVQIAQSTVPLNQWTHFMVTWTSGDYVRMYINGTLAGTSPSTFTGTLQPCNMPFMLGGSSQSWDLFFQGQMDEMQVWNAQLTQTQIQNWMNKSIDANHPQYAALRSYWRFNEGGGSAVIDEGSLGLVNTSISATYVTPGTAPVYSPPVITSFSPTTANIGANVTVNGQNFSPVASNNIVYFGGVKASVLTATATSLTVVVPAGAAYDMISVTSPVGCTGKSSIFFTPTFNCGASFDVNSFSTKYDFNTGSTPQCSAIGDLDGDGKQEVVVTNYGSHNLMVFRNNASVGNFGGTSLTAVVTLATGNGPQGVTLADYNGDGKLDIITANYGNTTVSVIKNNSTPGSFSFANKVDFATGFSPSRVAVGDIDLDGRPDIAVVNYQSHTLSILRNTSTSTTTSFAAKVDFSVVQSPQGVAIGDIDMDGKPDIAVSNFGGFPRTVSVFRNISTQGSFSTSSLDTRVDFVTANVASDVAIADFDRDGKNDMVSGNYQGQNVSVFRNTGSTGSIDASTFSGRVDLSAGFNFAVAVGDLNGDGRTDIVTPNLAPSVSVIENLSSPGSITSGSFAPKDDYTAGNFPLDASIGDLDGDGKPEIVVVNQNGNNFSVFKNTVPELYVWDGSAGTNWANSSNWSCGIAPVSTSDVLIPDVSGNSGNFPVINSGVANAHDITVDAGAIITVGAGASLSADGVLTNNGTITIGSGGNLVQSAASTLAGSGTFNVTRNGLTGNQYNFWSSPITNANTSLLSSTIYSYNPALGTADPNDDQPSDPGWIPASGPMQVAKGYAANGAGSVQFTGTVNNGDLPISVSVHASPNVSFNLIGNPYPCAVSGSSFLTANSSRITGTLYFWDDDNSGTTGYASNDYATWNGSGGVAGCGGHTPNGNIGSCQGFKVLATSAGNVSFTNAMRITNNSQFFSEAENQKIWLSARNANEYFNQTLIAFLGGATDNEDWFYDAQKIRGNINLSLFSYLNGNEMAIQGLAPIAEDRIIPLGLASGYETEVTIGIDSLCNFSPQAKVMLEDRQLNVFHDLRQATYTFNATEEEYTQRFFLHVLNAGPNNIGESEQKAINIYSNGNTVYMVWPGMEVKKENFTLFNMLGQEVYSQSISVANGISSVSLNSVPTGYYVARVSINGEMVSQKVFIQN